MKMNKKGFTLIEMLVVIAIIAVLVSIIVPTVSNSTVKAAAATDAANLRSVMAEVQVAVLSNPGATLADGTGKVEVKVGTEVVATFNTPAGKAVTVDGTAYVADKADMTVTLGTDGTIEAKYGDNGTIANLSIIAETGKKPA